MIEVKTKYNTYQVFKKKEADELGIAYEVEWRKKHRQLKGKYILTDTFRVVPVIAAGATFIDLPKYRYIVKNIYCIYEAKKDYVCQYGHNKHWFNLDKFPICNRDGRLRHPIEFLFLYHYRLTLNLGRTIRRIWGNLSNRMLQTFKSKIQNDGYLIEMASKNLRDVLEKAGLDGVTAVRRMDRAAALICEVADKLAKQEEVPLEEFMKVTALAYEMNKNLAKASTEEPEFISYNNQIPQHIPKLIEPISVEDS